MKPYFRIFGLILCLALIFTLLVGCGKDKGSLTGDSGDTSSVSSEIGTPNVSTPDNTASNSSNDPDTSSLTPSGTASGDTNSRSDTASDGTSSNTSSDSTVSESGTTPPPTADTDPTVFLDAQYKGDTVTVTASVKNNPGLVAFKFAVIFDKEKLTPEAIAQSDLKLGITSNVTQGAAQNGEVSVLYVSAAGFNENGQLFTLTFKVKDGTDGTAEFRIKSDSGSFLSTDAQTYLDLKTFGTKVDLK